VSSFLTAQKDNIIGLYSAIQVGRFGNKISVHHITLYKQVIGHNQPTEPLSRVWSHTGRS